MEGCSPLLIMPSSSGGGGNNSSSGWDAPFFWMMIGFSIEAHGYEVYDRSFREED